jgi:trimeric autotransporter adhesin
VSRLVVNLVVAAATLAWPAAPAHAATGDISTFAGTGAPAFAGDGGAATAAALHHPRDVEWLADGSVLVADTRNHRVRRIWPSGIIATIAGTGAPGFSGDGGAATSARLSSPTNLEPTGDGGFLIADLGNRRVRKVSPAGTIATVAGTGVAGSSGDGGPATSASLDEPTAVATTPDGGFLIADAGSHRVRAVSPGGTISTVAGAGAGGGDDDFDEGDGDDDYAGTGDGGPATLAVLGSPAGVAAAPGGGFLVSEYEGHRVRFVSPTGTIATVAGTGIAGPSGDGGAATSARLNQPSGISPLADGGFLVADSGSGRIREITPQGTVTTVAGGGQPGFAGDGGPAALASLNQPHAAVAGPAGALLISDAGNNRLRLIAGGAALLSVAPPTTGGGDPRAASRLLLRAPRSLRVSAHGTVRLQIGCPATAPERCRGTIRLQLRVRSRRGVVRAARSQVIARARYSIAPGSTRAVKLRLSRTARRLLRKRRTLPVRAVATRRGGPNIGAQSESVTLKLKAQRKRPGGRRG